MKRMNKTIGFENEKTMTGKVRVLAVKKSVLEDIALSQMERRKKRKIQC